MKYIWNMKDKGNLDRKIVCVCARERERSQRCAVGKGMFQAQGTKYTETLRQLGKLELKKTRVTRAVVLNKRHTPESSRKYVQNTSLNFISGNLPRWH